MGVTQIASHPSLDAVRFGFVEEMERRGWIREENIQFVFRNANRDPSLALPIARSFVSDGVDLIVPISTPSALAAAQATETIPIVFAGVTDPVGVGLVRELEEPGGNITGTSDRWPFKEQFDLFLDLQPELKCVGMLYAPGDEVSAVAVGEVKAIAEKQNINFLGLPVSGAQDLYSAARRVLSRCDAIYTGLDTLVVENFESILKAGNEARKPIFAGDPQTVERGAVATYGVSMEELGEETARIADRVLRGESAGKIAVTVVSGGRPYVNRESARTLGISIPASVESRAVFVSRAKR